jgi:osmotically-inducible protein OsmY
MRSTEQIERDVIEELGNDPELEQAAIAARVDAGIVRLRGSAPTYSAKLAARRAAERITGVRAIVDDVVVAPPAILQRTDAQLRKAIGTALDLNVQVGRGTVRFSVIEGRVYLDGVVARQVERCAAEATVAILAGVRAIDNRIRIEPDAPPSASMIEGIDRALRRSAELDCKHILIEAAPGGEIYLRGTVRSWAEVHDAERAAWSAPGVRGVVNRLAVVM